MGVWRAKAKRGAEAVDVAVDKGGRIKTLQQ
jgi:alanine dehydrogenase